MAEDRMLSDEILLGLIKANGGGGGTSDYSQLSNKPQINGVTLSGNKSASDLSLASLDANGKVPAAQLPSYVDDVINGYLYEGHFYEDAEHQTEITGESGKIYIDLETNKTYRWSGLAFVEISESLALGETASTAYAGDKGKANADAISAIKDGQTIDSFADVETALAGKQGTLTAGDYIQFDGNEISVKRTLDVPLIRYEFVSGTYPNMTIKKYVNEVFDSENTYEFTGTNWNRNIDENFTLYSERAQSWTPIWRIVLIKDSNEPEHEAGYATSWNVQSTYDFSYSFNSIDVSGKKLVIREEMDTALVGKQDTLTFDDTPTADSNNPVKSSGVKSAIDAAVASAYHHAGTKTCAELVAGLLVAANEGNVYNITDSGTTTADFIDGAGQPIKAGDNVGIAKISDNVYKFDLLSGFVDTTNFVQKSQTSGLLKNDGTVDTEIEGDVDSLKSGLTNVENELNGDAVAYPYADVITIPDAIPANVADCSVKVEPVQDLHGYSHPWVGGAGKNKCKTMSASTTANGVSFTLNDDGTITANRTSASENNAYVALPSVTLPAGTYRFSGCNGGFDTGYWIDFNYNGASHRQYTEELTATFTEETTVSPWINVYASFNAQNKVFSPMIRIDGTTSTYEPYSNLCPISGHTEASVQRDGVNIWDEQWEVGTINGATGYNDTDNRYIRSKNYILIDDRHQYMPVYSTIGTRIYMIYYDENKTHLGSSAQSNKTGTAFTPISGAKYMRFTILTGGQYNNDISINFPATYTSYVPYIGRNTYTIALGDTYYKGLLDVDTGIFTSYNVKRVLNDPDKWISTSGNIVYKYNEEFTDRKQYTADSYTGVFTSFIVMDSTSLYTGRWQSSDSNYFGIRDDNSLITLEQLKTRASAGELSICYELATPLTVQLTPQQIQLLKGTNTLYASTGQISVTVNGVSGAIGQMQEQIEDLQGQIDELPIFAEYSTTEQKTGKKWMGDDIYLKLVHISPVQTGDNNTFAHGIANINQPLGFYIRAFSVSNNEKYVTMPFRYNESFCVMGISMSQSNIQYSLGTSYGDYDLWAVCYYTKSTT